MTDDYTPSTAATAWKERIAEERQRQIAKGYTPAHDDEHGIPHLVEWAQYFAWKGEALKAEAMHEAIREAYERAAARLRAEGAAEANAVLATWLTEHDRYLSEVIWDECERQGRDFRRRKLAWSLSGTSDPRPVKPKNPYRRSVTPVPEEEQR